MIQIIPAVSIYGKKIARINNGDIHNLTIYDETPLDMAMRLEQSGVKRIHLIDLEGAQKGRLDDLHALEMIAGYTKLSIDFGGGITDDDNIRLAFEYGASAIHAASKAATDPELFSSWIISYGRNKVILSADSVGGKVVTGGWSKNTEVDLMSMIQYYHDQGILYLKCTDVPTDGSMKGPSLALYNKILNKFPSIKLMASGGIHSIDDLDRLQEIGVYGAILAKALYEDKISIKDLEKFMA